MNGHETKQSVHASCHCARCRFVIAAEPLQVSYCHCADCRKATGAPVSVFVGFDAEAVVSEGGAPDVRQSSAHAERLFCSRCGSPIGYRDTRLANELYLYIGILDEPARFMPELHAWVTEALPWLHIADDLPQYEGFSRRR